MSNEGSNQQLFLARIPHGVSGPQDFEVREAPIPVLKANELLIETHYVGIDAALRLITRDSDEFLFRVRPGDVVRGSVAGRIIESNNPAWRVGEYVNGSLGVQRYAISDGSGLERCDINQAPLGAWLGGFGVSGLTAYFAVFDACRPQPGQTVLINGAAGAVGSMAGQFAKLAGARVIGIAGGPEKCAWLINQLEYDVAIDYRRPDWFAHLKEAAPDRIDIIFDNVGGEIMDQSLKLIGMNGIVLMCGSTSQYAAEEMKGPANYIWLGTMRARLQGFVVFDYAHRYAEARKRMASWIKSGRIKIPQHVEAGDVGDFGAVFEKLYRGVNRGKMLLKLPAAGA
ncbi:MAG: NADP-dependent oxidoreductase [Gammaproteobacteria bacterium]|nr:NADP-dependent oxidoreductase [Gammaproteobacteria bacterium]